MSGLVLRTAERQMLVVCNGMLRAGSTLQYNLVRSLVEVLEVGTGEGFFFADDLTKSRARIDRWAEDSHHHVIKIHDLHPHVIDLAANGTARITYIYRDIRDVAVSAKRKFRYRGALLLKVLDTAIGLFEEMQALDGLLWQRYESVVEDLPRAVAEVSQFLQLTVDDAVIDRVVSESSIERNRQIAESQESPSFLVRLRKTLGKTPAGRILSRLGWNPQPIFDAKSLVHVDHFSKRAGQTEVWRSELNAAERKTLTARYQNWLQAQGYPL